MIYLLLIFFSLPSLFVITNFIHFLFTGKSAIPYFAKKALDIIILIIMPLLCFLIFDSAKNDCCDDSAIFSPNHKPTIYLLIFICLCAYFYAAYKTTLHSPLLEVLTNCVLVFAIFLNVIIAIQIGLPLFLFGNLSIIMLFIMQLFENQKQFLTAQKGVNPNTYGKFEYHAWQILSLKLIYKVPVFFILFIPFFLIMTSLLLLFGQKPDSLIRAFTDTYKHGFSQLDYMCNNVSCGGHYLCSVAAKGNRKFVKAHRYGQRHGQLIICNRQLLVSNAFEELIVQKFPKLHKIIRSNYNKIGNLIHQYYFVFNKKWVSNTVYIIMKPIEWTFVIVLYIADKNPENRIATQYISQVHKIEIEKLMNQKDNSV